MIVADNGVRKPYGERTTACGTHHVAHLVAAWCAPAGRSIAGHLLGVRGRDIFLFRQPHPVVRLEAGAPATVAEQIVARLGDTFTELDAPRPS